MHCVYLSLGSNRGWRKRNLMRAVSLIGERLGTVVKQSSMLETAPVGFASKHKFLNMCLELQTELPPYELLEGCEQIERDLGRTRKSVNGNYHDRRIDIDILCYDDLQMDTPRLTLPHPRMKERDFVMIPLREICSKP